MMDMKLYRISFPRSSTLLVDCEDEYEAVQFALTKLVVEDVTEQHDAELCREHK